MKYTLLFLIFSCVGSFGWANNDYTRTTTETCTGNCPTQGGVSTSNGAQQAQNDPAGCSAACFNAGKALSSSNTKIDAGNCSATVDGVSCHCIAMNTASSSNKICVSSQAAQTCAGSNFDSSGVCMGSNASNSDPDSIQSPEGQACLRDTSSAVSTCDPNKSADVGAVMQMAQGMQQTLAQASGSSFAAACGTIGKVSEAASAATAIYKGYCSYEYSKCQKSCEAAFDASTAAAKSLSADPATRQLASEKKAIIAQQKKCNGMTENLAEASQAIMGLVGAKLNMDQCKNMMADCNLNPTSPTCLASTDCTNPTAQQTNPVCICQINPADSRCGGGANSNLASGLGGPAQVSSGATSDGSLGNFGLGSDNGYGNSVDPGANAGKEGPSQNLAQGMQGGHNLGSTGSVNNAYTPPGGASKDGSKANVLSGYYGGSGGGGMFGSSGGSGNSGSGSGGYRPGGLAGNGKNHLDLKQFLPGGAHDPARGIAGISGPDGITGPNSDIWQKVNTRYFSVTPSLLP